MTDTQDLFTRKQYITSDLSDRKVAHELHRKYYAQFVNDKTISWVVYSIGSHEILGSEDPHFNDIDMRRWDLLVSGMPRAILFSDVGDHASPAGLVCVAKEAARQYVDRQKAAA